MDIRERVRPAIRNRNSKFLLAARLESVATHHIKDRKLPRPVAVTTALSDELAIDWELLEEDRLLSIYGFDYLGDIFGAVSRNIIEFDCDAIFPLAVPAALSIEDGKVQTEANEHALQLIDIHIFRENAIHHGLALL
jgi:hypothetical protein